MTDKYITSSQYEKGLDSIKEYIDKLIPHIEYPVLFTLPADKVLEIYNSTNHAMEFDKPSNIDLNKEIIMTHNNENISRENSQINYINYQNSNITISFHIGFDINKNTNENKMVITISYLNTNITSDLVLKQVNHKYLNNKYLKKDVAIQNSITIGTRILGDNIGKYSFSNGNRVTASGDYSHAEGERTMASGEASHAEGNYSTASSNFSHAEGNWSTASGFSSHVEGSETTASGDYSHAEGNETTASGESSHAEGNRTKASGVYSHAEGMDTEALIAGSHAEGWGTTASGDYSHTEGYFTKASSEAQHVQGKYNIEDKDNKYAHIVGNGTDDTVRSNAHTLDWEGNAWFAGKLTQEGTPTDDKDLITKKYVDDKISNIPDAYTLLYPKEVDRTIAYYDIYDLPLGDYRIAQQDSIRTWNICVYVNNIRTQLFSTQNSRGFSFSKRINITGTADGKSGRLITIDTYSMTTGGETYTWMVYDDGSVDVKNHKATILSAYTNTEFTPTKDYQPATKKYVDDAKASIVVPNKTSELTNDSGFLTSIPEEYVTETKLTSKGYLTEHQSLDGYAKTEYVDSKTTLEETIFEGVASDTLNDYWTHCSLVDGEGCWVIDKEVIIGENIENPYYIEINGTDIYSPENSTYDATNKAWLYDYTMDNGKKLFICANYENQNKMVVPWDGMGSYDKLKIFTRTELGKKIEEQQQHSMNKLATKKYVDDNTPIKSLPVNPTTKTAATFDINNISSSGCYALPKRADGTQWTNLRMRAIINDGSGNSKVLLLTGYQNFVFYVNIESKKIYCDNLRIVYNIGTTDDTTYIRTEPYYLPTTNTKEFTPTSDYNPATKKYVDDTKASIVVPTKTSELTNDSNFLTEHQSLTNYATIEYVDSKLTTNYVSKEELTESTKPADTTTVKTTLNNILGGDYIE